MHLNVRASGDYVHHLEACLTWGSLFVWSISVPSRGFHEAKELLCALLHGLVYRDEC